MKKLIFEKVVFRQKWGLGIFLTLGIKRARKIDPAMLNMSPWGLTATHFLKKIIFGTTFTRWVAVRPHGPIFNMEGSIFRARSDPSVKKMPRLHFWRKTTFSNINFVVNFSLSTCLYVSSYLCHLYPRHICLTSLVVEIIILDVFFISNNSRSTTYGGY